MASSRNQRKSPEEALRAAVTALEDLTKRQTFVLVRPFDHLLPDQVEAEFDRMIGDKEGPVRQLDIVLESDGGDADAAYKSVLVFRHYASNVRIVVPSWAKSAATLFCLGSDTIAIAPAVAELGPLDAQVTDPRNPAVPMSALDGYQSVEYIRDYALETHHLTVMQMLGRTGFRVPLGEVLEKAGAFANDLISPMMSQVRPLDFGGWGRTLDVGKVYAERLLSRYNMHAEASNQIREVADTLVYGYPHHPFAIDLHEAKALGLSAEPLPREEYRAARAVVKAAFQCRVEVCDDGHKLQPGFAGFPAEAPQKTDRKDRKEEKTDGVAEEEAVRAMRGHSVGARSDRN